MDADLSHDPAYLPPMLALLERCDVVIGSRYIRDGGTVNWGIGRILLSWLANTFAAILLQIPAHDVTSGYRLYRRNALEWIRTTEVKSTGYSFLGELLYRAHRAGARIVEHPIIFHDRTLGVSKLHRREIYLGALNLLRLRFSKNAPALGLDLDPLVARAGICDCLHDAHVAHAILEVGMRADPAFRFHGRDKIILDLPAALELRR